MVVKCSKVIKTCKYGAVFNDSTKFCDYLCKTGKRRGCSVDECDKYEKKKTKKWKY